MIISRTPFRVSFFGGGTDMPAFYQEEEGAVVSTSIDKYIYITINNRFDDTYRLSYSKTEIVDRVDQIEHPIFKAVLSLHGQGTKGLEIISMADIPSGTGLGSSSSFTVGVLHSLKAHQGKFQTAEDLAREACNIEINYVKEPIGKQDQYAAAYGGLRCIRFLKNGQVQADPIICSDQTVQSLESSMMVFFTGFSRSASKILSQQSANIKTKMNNLKKMRDSALHAKKILESNGSVEDLGKMLNEAWILKKEMAQGISNGDIDLYYEKALKAGAWGGKILGAGGGGFMMFLCAPEKQEELKRELSELRHIPMNFEKLGSKIIFVS